MSKILKVAQNKRGLGLMGVLDLQKQGIVPIKLRKLHRLFVEDHKLAEKYYNAASNLFAAYAIPGQSFLEANPKEGGLYHVSHHNVGYKDKWTIRLHLPKTARNSVGEEILVKNARDQILTIKLGQIDGKPVLGYEYKRRWVDGGCPRDDYQEVELDIYANKNLYVLQDFQVYDSYYRLKEKKELDKIGEEKYTNLFGIDGPVGIWSEIYYAGYYKTMSYSNWNGILAYSLNMLHADSDPESRFAVLGKRIKDLSQTKDISAEETKEDLQAEGEKSPQKMQKNKEFYKKKFDEIQEIMGNPHR